MVNDVDMSNGCVAPVKIVITWVLHLSLVMYDDDSSTLTLTRN